jgi:2-succinyl-5-enolpyruvyl-6-hydroxy-3-cyclohexene-1-carboxylate synthase
VRALDGYCRGRRDLAIASQRGANGIDGLIAGATGAALAARGPVALLLGDVSFAHDLGSLATARLAAAAGTPLAIVVIDNDGGRIFEQLPLGAASAAASPGALAADDFARFWLTPPAVDIAAAAAAFGLRCTAPQSAAAIGEAVRDALARPGCSVVHVRVAPSSAGDTRRRLREALVDAAPEILAPLARSNP